MRPDPPKTNLPIILAVIAGAGLLVAGVSLFWEPAPRPYRTSPESAPPAAAVAPAVTTASAAPGPPAAVTGPAPAPGSAGMIVGIDPETGKLGMPSRESRARMSQAPALDRSMTGLTVVTRPDGSKLIDLQGRFQEYTVIHLTPDGRTVEACVQGPELDAALEGAAEPSSDHEVR